MKRAIGVRICVILLVIVLPRIATAQGFSAGAMVGTVRDTSGAVLPGVMVEATSPALTEGMRTTVTDNEGHYQLADLRSGTYRITFSLPGFATFVREMLQLTTNFTATVNAMLQVGDIQETVTVAGESPLVDVRNVNQSTTLSNDLLDALPTAKNVFSIIALMPSIVAPPNQQDVGGSQGEASTRLTIHGSRRNDMKMLQDGLRVGSLNSSGAGRGFLINPLGAEEVVIAVGGGGSAEYSSGGVQVNLIPKNGENRFSGTFFTHYAGPSMQADNLTDDLRTQGLRSVNSIRAIYDLNAVVGGPIVRNRLWFVTAHRWWGRTLRIGDLYHDSNLDDWVYTPDRNRPVDAEEDAFSNGVRLTFQATPKDRVNFAFEPQQWVSQMNAASLGSTNRAIEGQTRGGGAFCPDMTSIQATWNRPHSNNLLFEVGAGMLLFDHHDKRGCAGEIDRVPIQEQSPGATPALWHGVGVYQTDKQKPLNVRASVSYLRARHSVKAGMYFLNAFEASEYRFRAPIDTRGIPLAYRVNNGIPNRITQFVSPTFRDVMLREVGLFVQDQWSLGRATITAGLRFEYMRQGNRAVSIEGGALSGSRSFDEIDCIPCWKDLAPRAAVAYDLFGDGKTVLKAGVGRYLQSTTDDIAEQFSPVSAGTVASTTRSWGDANGNWFPDCNLTDPARNGECGPMANPDFGKTNLTTSPDPDWITGWSKRMYNWQTSVSVQRELRPGTAVSVGYYRTWFGNFYVTDNTEITSADFDPFCVTAPTDQRLGSMSGKEICGLYDIKPEKFGLENNVVGLASKFGDYREMFNGGDVSFQARLPRATMFGAGLSVGNSVGIPVGIGDVQSATDRCFVVDSPQQLFNCKAGNPYRTQFRMNTAIPLPWQLQFAAVYQNLPSPIAGALTTFTNAQIAPSLGRSLAGGTANITIDLFAPQSKFLDGRIQQLDVRLSKKLQVRRLRLQINTDLYNVFNGSPVLATNTTYGTNGATYLRPQTILDARLFKAGVQIDF